MKSLLNLRGISGQIAALVVVSIAALHLIITASFLLHRPDQPEPAERGHGQLAAAVQLLGAAPASERPRLSADIARAFPQLGIEILPTGQMPAAGEPDGFNPHGLQRRLGHEYRIFQLTSGDEPRKLGIGLPDGMMISANVLPDRPRPPLLGGPWMMTLLFAVISVTLLGLWAARALTAPLSSFAKAAESFSLNGAAAPLPERGPEEIRSVARALNRMRQRITGLIDDRTKMLAAISHDLRTPITRMRLRSEFIENETHRSRMLSDLDQMRAMLESVLSFLRNGRRLEAMTLADIASTLQLITDQFADMGRKVAYDGPTHAMATVRPDDLHRAVTNLVENAVRFGAEAVIRLRVSADQLTINVEDDGPGISDALKQNMLEPFVRGDEARNMDEAAGFGLGLSITNAIVLAHGGTLSLHDRQPRGLVVRMLLPVRQQSERSAA
ncbi:HAMP domain-containing protein [Bradyrhizobium sp. AUGA SZCCT0283]|nr:ATP-binding protein [Bradyrhizobium sp. AUGA SZCCT0283]MBR1273981.1 HAMP domain-containing protein [Bradyrhizobium sp. AUGA SZCCT0283]